MSMKLLGKTLDIHGGGLDLQFPHHENELAQSESFTGQTFARYWLHNGLMRIRSQSQKIKDHEGVDVDPGRLEKMSKSLGNEIVVSEVFKKHEPETLRLLLLATHYRSPIEYSEDRLREMSRSLEGFYRFFERYTRITGGDFYKVAAPSRFAPFNLSGTPSEFLAEMSRLRGTFLDSLADDFNTGGAVGMLYEVLTALNRFADTKNLESVSASTEAKAEFQRGVVVLRELSQILGLFREPIAAATGGTDELVKGLMQLLIDLRAEARKAKNYTMGDQIRKRLEALKIILEDYPGGTGWRVGEPPQRK
jgi:cysteinyl-tRNA synthetase